MNMALYINTTQLIITCNKGWNMNCLKNFYNQQYQLQGSLINTKNIGKINPLFALVHDSDAQSTDDTPLPMQHYKSLIQYNIYPDTRYVICVSRDVLSYILFNIKHDFTLYFYMYMYKVTDY